MENKWFVRTADTKAVEQVPGVTRRTMSYNEEIMMCQFELQTGAEIALHAHAAIQNGYVLSGRMQFFKQDGSSVIVEEGDSYVFDSNEPHGVTCLEHAFVVENFLPARKEFM